MQKLAPVRQGAEETAVVEPGTLQKHHANLHCVATATSRRIACKGERCKQKRHESNNGAAQGGAADLQGLVDLLPCSLGGIQSVDQLDVVQQVTGGTGQQLQDLVLKLSLHTGHVTLAVYSMKLQMAGMAKPIPAVLRSA